MQRATMALLALFAALACGCGDDNDSGGTPPLIESLRDETGDGLVVIGEQVTLVGVSDAAARVTIAGLEAPIVSAAGDFDVTKPAAGASPGNALLPCARGHPCKPGEASCASPARDSTRRKR